MKNTPSIVQTLSHLSTGIVVVTFTKKGDGSTRVMRCTTNFGLIPEAYHPKTSRNTPAGLRCVFDLDALGWRSFYEESVIDATPISIAA